jgi:metal-sulfur cluster biosynthetic enzyme
MSLTVEDVKEKLREVYDPEISINILDLGLIYEIDVQQSHVIIVHTLTSMMCPFAEQICSDIEGAVLSVNGVETIDRQLVFEPPFTMEMVPEETRFIMGWL